MSHNINYRLFLCSQLFILFLLIGGCNKDSFLREKPIDFLTPSNSYSTPSGAKQGIAAINAEIRDIFFSGDDGELQILKAVGTDEAFYGEDPGGTEFLSNYFTNLIPSQYWVSGFWNNSYSIIQHTDVLISEIENSESDEWTGQAEKDNLIATAKFFRAFTYRFLVILWGDVPLVDTVIDRAKVDFVRAPKGDIYNLMESDLIFGTLHLPIPSKDLPSGTITQGAAWHLLSDLYLMKKEYELSVDAASKVINDFGYGLMKSRFGTQLGHDIFGSGDVYYDLFANGNQNFSGNNEGIWVLQYEGNVPGGGANTGERAWGPAYFRIGSTPDGFPAFRGEFFNGNYTGYSDTLGRPVAWTRPTNYTSYLVWGDDWNKDIRNAEHNIKRNFYYDSPGSAYDRKRINFNEYPAGTRDPIKDTCQYIFPYWIKMASPLHHFSDPARSGGGFSDKDVYGFRLAETYLIRAEAYLNMGKEELAAIDINEVRSRAQATPVQSSAVTIDFILDERARELYGEEFRMLTLMRLGKLVERVKKYNNNPLNPGLNIQAYNNLWPIPLNEIDQTNGSVVQNPGY